MTKLEEIRKRKAIYQVSRRLREHAKTGMFAEMKKDLAVSEVIINSRPNMGDFGDWARTADLFVFEKGTVLDVRYVVWRPFSELCLADGKRTYRFSLWNVQGSILRSVKFYFDEERKRFWDSFANESYRFGVLKERLELKDFNVRYGWTSSAREDVSFAPGHLFYFYRKDWSSACACDDQGENYFFGSWDLLKAQHCMMLFKDEQSARAASAAWSQACGAKPA